MKTALWIIAFAQMYGIVESWLWSIHWRVKGKREFDRLAIERSAKLENILSSYDAHYGKDDNGK
jgi:hypothetical protein